MPPALDARGRRPVGPLCTPLCDIVVTFRRRRIGAPRSYSATHSDSAPWELNPPFPLITSQRVHQKRVNQSRNQGRRRGKKPP